MPMLILVAGADPVDAAEALDDADGVPMDVVVDQIVAILEVLALRDAIRRDEEIDFLVPPLDEGEDVVLVLRRVLVESLYIAWHFPLLPQQTT